MSKFTSKFLIFLLYFFLLAGGLWHVLGVFTTIMKILAAPTLIFVSILAAWDAAAGMTQENKRPFSLWLVIIFVGSFFAEYLGVKTGLIFGAYKYQNSLQPQLGGVPVAIGFAWIGILLSSLGVVVKFFPKSKKLLTPLLVALFMVLFDFVMEPAAVYLNYWHWDGTHIPVLNYITWFVLGFFFLLIGEKMDLLRQIRNKQLYHLYVAQLLYFLLIDLKIII